MTCHASTRRPHMIQGTEYAPTAATRRPGDRIRPSDGHTGPRGTDTSPRRPHGAQGIGYTPRWPYMAQGIGHAPTATTQNPKDRTRPHGHHTVPRDKERFHDGHTGPRGLATPPRQPHGAQGTGHAHMAATRGLMDRPRPHGHHTGPRG